MAIDAIISTLVRHLEHEHQRPTPQQPALRDAHPKHHGCVKAIFKIERDLPDQLRQGLFARPEEYEAWIRFSNAFKVRHDLDRDARGMAIKVMDVKKSKSTTQDFLLVTHDVFFARDPSDFVDFPAAVAGAKSSMGLIMRVFGFFFGIKPFRFRWRGHLALQRSLNWATNPLVRTYFSQIPFRFGDSAAKFRAIPRQHGRPHQWVQLWFRVLLYQWSWLHRVKFERWRNVLQTAMLRYLRTRPAIFDFEVQLQKEGMPLDDAVTRWSTRRSPYRKVATITIDSVDIDPANPVDATLATMMAFGQHLSYTPWHAIPEHEPVGSINRARKAVYEAISRLRHGLNQVEIREPRPGETQAEYLHAITPHHHQASSPVLPGRVR